MSKDRFEVAHDTPMQVGESPLWHPVESALYWVDINGRAVHRLHPASGKHSMWSMPSEPSSLARDAGDGLIVAMRTGFYHLNTSDGSLDQIAGAPYDTSLYRFNDGKVDPAGRFWVGTMYEPRTEASAEMYVLERGALHKAWSGGMTVSNGLGFSPDGRTMYHSDTTSHRIDKYDFDVATGTASNPQRLREFMLDKSSPEYGGRPDGAAVDSEGAYWCAMIDGGKLLRLSPEGDILREVLLPLRAPTMLAFGGPSLHTLFITSIGHGRSAAEVEQYPLTGKLLTLRVDVAGREEPAYRA